MTPYAHQIAIAAEAVEILKEHMIVYLAMEERTGKTLTAILAAEQLTSCPNVLVITKKKALQGWEDTLAAFPTQHKFTLTNYHQASKIVTSYDLVIIDEAHNYISGYPKTSKLWADIKQLTRGKPIIFSSATPYAQGYQLLYHQFALSSWSPWAKHKNFYQWFSVFGIPKTLFTSGRQIPQYNNVLPMVFDSVSHLFITRTRKELDFTHEPEDITHYVTLEEATKELYNSLVKDRIAKVTDIELVCDTVMKLRTSLHMLEGGVAKVNSTYLVCPNREKIDYILANWGDTEDVVIMYNYIAEKTKLEAVFTKAKILQATSYAEGVDLSGYPHLVIYSQDWSTARHSQRRARQANVQRREEIKVHFLLVEKAISEQVYAAVSKNKVNYIDSLYSGETL